MILNRNVIVALTMTGAAAIAAIVAYQRHAQQLERTQDKDDVDSWGIEGGRALWPVVENPLS